MSTLLLPISQISEDAALQPRIDGLDFDHVGALEAVVEAWPPIKVVTSGTQYLLVDGFHRLAAARALGLESIHATVLPAPGDGDLLGLAFDLNISHGRPLSLNDRRQFAARLLKRGPELSDREIGRRAGLVQPTVGKIRLQLEATAQIEQVETRVGRDGRNYAASQRSRVGVSRGLPQAYATGSTTLERIADSFTSTSRRGQREITRYLERIADALEDQERLKAFDTLDTAAKACVAILGDEGAKKLASRLGWAARNIAGIAEALGDAPDEAETAGIVR